MADQMALQETPVDSHVRRPRESTAARTIRRTINILLPAIGIGLFLAIWNWGPLWLGLQKFEVPTLSEDIQALQSNWNTIGPELEESIADALAGFFVGNILALLGAILFTQSRIAERTFFPLAIVFQAIPIVVIAPVSLQIFASLGWGPYDPLPLLNTGLKPILLVTVLITFFPTLVNMTGGLKDIDPNLYELMRLIGSSPLRGRAAQLQTSAGEHSWLGALPWRIAADIVAGLAETSEQLRLLWRLRLPSSMPYLFASLKITATLCFVGAFVGEFVVSANVGIGGYIKQFEIQQEWPQAFACVVVFILATLAWVGVIVLAERVLFPWRQQR